MQLVVDAHQERMLVIAFSNPAEVMLDVFGSRVGLDELFGHFVEYHPGIISCDYYD